MQFLLFFIFICSKLLAALLAVCRNIKNDPIEFFCVCLRVVVELKPSMSVYFLSGSPLCTLIFVVPQTFLGRLPLIKKLALDFLFSQKIEIVEPVLASDGKSVLEATKIFLWKNEVCHFVHSQQTARCVFGQNCFAQLHRIPVVEIKFLCIENRVEPVCSLGPEVGYFGCKVGRKLFCPQGWIH